MPIPPIGGRRLTLVRDKTEPKPTPLQCLRVAHQQILRDLTDATFSIECGDNRPLTITEVLKLYEAMLVLLSIDDSVANKRASIGLLETMIKLITDCCGEHPAYRHQRLDLHARVRRLRDQIGHRN